MQHLYPGLVLVISSLSAQSAKAVAAEPKRGGTLTLGITRDISVMNPLVDTGSTQKCIRDLMFEPLLAIDPKGNLQPAYVKGFTTAYDGEFVWGGGGLNWAWLEKQNGGSVL